MKTKIIFTLALAACTTIGFAQKKEVKTLEKAVKAGNYGEAKAAIAPAEAMMAEMDDKYKERFLLAKGQTFLGLENSSLEELKDAADAFIALKDSKYKVEARNGLQNTIAAIVNGAIEDQNSKNYVSSAQSLDQAYRYSPKDTLYLYYAANNYINAKEYDKALEGYIELKDLNFSGVESVYTATVVATGEVEEFGNKQERDFSVLAKTHINPAVKTTDSKRGDIAKQIALLYLALGEDDKALQAMKEARAQNPEDLNLMRSEADVYLKMGDMAKYKTVIEQVVAKDPNNPELLYNLGVSAASIGNDDEALEYYEKVIALDPTYAAAYNNIAVMKLAEERAIVEEMNNVGTSRAEYARYDALKEKRQNVYKTAAPYLQKALDNDPDNIEVAKTLFGIYQYLGETSKTDALKAKIEALETSGGN